jgi:hypothetical protein
MISAPPQGFLASALMDSAVDGATLVVSGGRAAVNLANANTWTAAQTFNAEATFSSGITGTGSTGTLTAGSGILDTANTWTAPQTMDTYGPSINNTIAGDVAFGVWNYAGNVVNGTALNLGAIQFKYDNSATNTGMMGMRGWTDSTGSLTGFQLWFYSYVLGASAMAIDYFTGDVSVYGDFTALSSAGASGGGIIQAPNWNGTTWGLQIGAYVGGIAGIMLNAPSGFANWFEQFMVNGANMWHVDASGNAAAAGTVSGAALAANNWNSDTPVNASLSTTVSNTSTTVLSSGFGISLATLANSTSILVNSLLRVSNYFVGLLYRSTSGIPAAGTAPPSGDVQVSAIPTSTSDGFTLATITVLDTGLTTGTTYYYYVAFYSTTSGDAAAIYASTTGYPSSIMAKSV